MGWNWWGPTNVRRLPAGSKSKKETFDPAGQNRHYFSTNVSAIGPPLTRLIQFV